ncbi:MAG: hypothetical protein KatS3mg023_0188 [Armatimonadota bacterium]|nr:MAG: hypothetical protein KatS3mg023_0188 [Armatimonadota bacterium]
MTEWFSRWRLLGMVSVIAGFLLVAVPSARAFSGEDILRGNPWYHQLLTERAARACGFSEPATNTLKWHADYIDSYGYNPLWWAAGGFNRLKVSLATQGELAKLHFDDLFSTLQVEANWKRILAGTLVGLLWAKEQNDVSAAQNILGISLHAIQDFYAHSNWVDAPDRRNRTWFEVPPEERKRMSLWTGAYEKPVQLGVKPHGKMEPAATLLKMSGVAEIMPVVCSPFSPLSNSGLCQQWKNVQDGTPIQPQVLGVRVPDNAVYLSPPGIALDSRWVANIAVQVRGITDVTGEQLFETALALAERTSVQWLTILEEKMNALGAGEFWQRVKTTGFAESERTRQFERYHNLPYTFLSAGAYPTPAFRAAGDNQFFLRVRLKTASQTGSGTDADIYLEAGGQKFLLDYAPRTNPILAVNDFEAGDDMVYVVGPLPSLPESITLRNDAATGWEVVESLGRAFVEGVEWAVSNARTFLLSLIGGNADHVATSKKVWTAEELARVGAGGSEFSVSLNGGGEGKYTVYGTIRQVQQGSDATGEWAEYRVSLDRLYCNDESKWDRGSDSDEPFVLALLVPLPGNVQKHRAGPYSDVDDKESRNIGHVFQTVRIPKGSGMLSLALSLWESDDESAADRDNLLNKFAGETDAKTETPRRGFLDTLGAAIAADWRPAHIEVYAFSRVDSLRSGKVLDTSVNQWVKADKSITFRLNRSAVRDWRVSPSALEQLPVRLPVFHPPVMRQ